MAQQKPAQDVWAEHLLTLRLTLDMAPGKPGIVLECTIPGRRGVMSRMWPTVDQRITGAQLEDLVSAVAELTRMRLLATGFIQEALPLD